MMCLYSVDVIPEFVKLPPSITVQNETSTYSCVAKAGWGAKVHWINTSSDSVIPEYSANDTNLPSVYVTYSMYNVSVVLKAKNPGYNVSAIDSVYPVHNVTLHLNGTLYHGSNITFTCKVTGMNEKFLQKYNVSDDDFTHFMTVHINATKTLLSSNLMSSISDLTLGPIIGVISGAILILAICTLVVIFCYKKRLRQQKQTKVLINPPFGLFTAESAIDSKLFISEKMQFPREKITLLHVLGKLTLLYNS